MTRTVRIEGEVVYIPLTQGYEAVIDPNRVALPTTTKETDRA